MQKEHYTNGNQEISNYTYIARWKHYNEGKQRICECKVFLKGMKSCDSKGYAFCSLKDNYVKNTGRKISLSKALKKYGFPKNERKLFWDEYNKEIGLDK